MSNASPAQTGTALPAVPTESRTGLVYIITAILTASSTIAFALRLYTRCFLLKTAGADDWTMLVAQILAIVAGVATALGEYIKRCTMVNPVINDSCRGVSRLGPPYSIIVDVKHSRIINCE